MDPERWQRIEAVFQSALEYDPGRRAAFLDAACADDPALRAEVDSLIDGYDRSASLSHAPGFEDGLRLFERSLNGQQQALVGRQIGSYRIIREIGRGGMGAVFLASRADDAYQKEVAIKLIALGPNPELLAHHFHTERQILANLDHPNITSLLDGGTTADGLSYLVMDYIIGQPIDEYCDARRLTIRERLRLFRTVCDAVHYAHQHLVVHRDLKPANVLVTSDGVPRLLDFGIAKILTTQPSAQAGRTATAFPVMTPGYASPEQVRGDPVTTASDVYSLGVILCELLTSRRPYTIKSDSPIDVFHAVCEQEPRKPSTLVSVVEEVDGSRQNAGAGSAPGVIAEKRRSVPERLRRQLKGDLDNIVLKALRKEPQRRYGSVEQFSEDVRQYLEGLPVSAHRGSWSYRARKFAGRHRAGVGAAALVAISLVAGIVSTTWQARAARIERAKAERQFNDVRRLTTSFLFEFHTAIQDLPGSTPARRLLVQRALEYLTKLAAEAQGDAGLQRELAEAYLKVGDVQGNPYRPNLGDTDGAARSYERALEISNALTEADPTQSQSRRYLARSHESLGKLLPVLGNPSSAIVHLRQAAAILESLAVAAPLDKQLRNELAESYQALGDLQGHSGLQNLGDPVSALASYRRSLTLYQAMLADDSADAAARRGTAIVQIRTGDMLVFRDDLRGGMDAYRSALATMEQLTSADAANAADQNRLALANRKVGGMYEDLGNAGEALKYYRRATSINEHLMAADPSNVQASMNLAISLRWSGDLMNKTGDTTGALHSYRSVLGILDRLSAAEPSNLVVRTRRSELLIQIAHVLTRAGQRAQAGLMASRGLTMERELAERPDATPDDLSQYALDFITCEPADLREPVAALQYALRSVTKSGGTDSDDLDILAQAYFANRNVAQAVVTEERALGLLAVPQPGERVPPTRRRIEAHLARYRAEDVGQR